MVACSRTCLSLLATLLALFHTVFSITARGGLHQNARPPMRQNNQAIQRSQGLVQKIIHQKLEALETEKRQLELESNSSEPISANFSDPPSLLDSMGSEDYKHATNLQDAEEKPSTAGEQPSEAVWSLLNDVSDTEISNNRKARDADDTEDPIEDNSTTTTSNQTPPLPPSVPLAGTNSENRDGQLQDGVNYSTVVLGVCIVAVVVAVVVGGIALVVVRRRRAAKHSERRRARAVHRIGTAAASKTPIPKVAVASPAGYLPPKRGAISQSKTLTKSLDTRASRLRKVASHDRADSGEKLRVRDSMPTKTTEETNETVDDETKKRVRSKKTKVARQTETARNPRRSRSTVPSSNGKSTPSKTLTSTAQSTSEKSSAKN